MSIAARELTEFCRPLDDLYRALFSHWEEKVVEENNHQILEQFDMGHVNGRRALEMLRDLRAQNNMFVKEAFGSEKRAFAVIAEGTQKAFLRDSDILRRCLSRGVSEELKYCSLVLFKQGGGTDSDFRSANVDIILKSLKQWLDTFFLPVFQVVLNKESFEMEYRNDMIKRITKFVTKRLSLGNAPRNIWDAVKKVEELFISVSKNDLISAHLLSSHRF